jgi:acetolactate synthase-1/3 small subunit
MTIVVNADDITARHIEAHLYSLVNVLRVDNVTHSDSVERDLALIKVQANAETRPAVIQLVDVFRGKMVDITPESLVVEVTGPRKKIDAMLDMVRPYGVIEMARTGIVAMSRGPNAPSLSPEFVAARVPEEATGFLPRPTA